MNKAFKVIWSEARNAYVVVSEMAKSHGTKSCSTKKLLAMLIAAGIMTCASAVPVMAKDVHEHLAKDATKIAIGKDAEAKGEDSVAIGEDAKAETRQRLTSSITKEKEEKEKEEVKEEKE